MRVLKVPPKPDVARLDSITRHPMLVSLLTFLLTGVVGAGLTFWIGQQAKNIELARQQETARKSAVENLSRYIYERRTRAEMLASSIKRNAPMSEIQDRKKSYDESFVKWNTEVKANLFSIRNVLGESDYSFFEHSVETMLVSGAFSPLDKCVTDSYDLTLLGRQSEAAQVLILCNSRGLLALVLDCGYAITDELYKLAGKATDRTSAEIEVRFKCGYANLQ
jgi:hypothetical protein